jgi:hypothetical protein
MEAEDPQGFIESDIKYDLVPARSGGLFAIWSSMGCFLFSAALHKDVVIQ